jgi:hypothetical protein
MPDESSVELWHERDERGTRSLWLRRLSDGRLSIEGQDLGPGVAIFGEGLSEYEWAWTVAAADSPAHHGTPWRPVWRRPRHRATGVGPRE